MKVLFLDIDGVLNSFKWIENGGKFGRGPGYKQSPTKEQLSWDPSTINELRRVVTETGCHIVISSSWRGWGDMARQIWQAMFACYDWADAPVIGETPDLPHWNGKVYLATIRGDEVAAWLKDHPEVTHFACVDDNSDFHPGQNLVQTDIANGLTAVESNRLINLLGKLT